ncbi:MAG: class I SAM-dependent rRNA methyltransferase, partial [Clostridia bacterium]|nr:class I SAM-dependent rRNA methyltransferase [Clostridia bacterium]
MTTLSLQAGKEHRFLRGERTVYVGEVAHIEGEITLGGEADVVSSRGQFLGRGFLSPSSKQLLRIVTRERRPLDESLFEELLREAIAYRRMLGSDSCCRLVFGDADSLPGLTVDRFESVLSIQTLTAGMDQRKEILCDLLERLLHPAAIYERNDVAVRKKEGLPLKKGLLRGSLPSELLVRENGFLIKIDVENGQKTGSYLDQRENHAAIAPYVAGKRVLDACCCTGGFGLHAAGYGAEFVTASDIS